MLPGLGVTATATLLPVANEWQVSLLYESTRRDFNLGEISTPYIANTRDMNLLGGKTGGRFPVKKKAKKPYMHLILRAHTHTSMRVLLRHSRQISIHRRSCGSVGSVGHEFANPLLTVLVVEVVTKRNLDGFSAR